MGRHNLQGRPIRFTSWNGYGANIEQLAKAAPMAGLLQPHRRRRRRGALDPAGGRTQGPVLRVAVAGHVPLLVGQPAVEPGFPRDRFISRSYQGLESVILRLGQKTLSVPVDDRVAALVPFRGPGGPSGGSFKYVSASDLVGKRCPGQPQGQDRPAGHHRARACRTCGSRRWAKPIPGWRRTPT
jgi:adenylate cyclase